ncbi:alpha/beta fold hydrolase [Anaerocolumna sp. MB42-C2]|uniref:alpha/beta fold hydrolase n=1 Tax=Anaerocolumna sp. MB42-C2 TaxID=3070997 RepID=UPI0027DFDA4A|nr:alpha/beta hydrolase [Anaerocolumna sp. MB42-C2]WMJ87566.1 alpha/beta hydrolase [Anaerocolumna sp. MB42-C2]
MIFKETGHNAFPTMIFLHGGGLSDWSLKPIVDEFKNNFHVITPIIDGHGEAATETFTNITDSAEKLIHYIDTQCNGRVFAIAGLSIGAQIVTEVIFQRDDITQYAIIESALVYPIKGITNITVPTYQMFYGLVKQRWFSKLQAKSLCVPSNMFEIYYQDSMKMSKQSLINMTLSNGSYDLKEPISNTKTKVLIIVGEKEISVMKKSAQKIHKNIPGSELYTAPGMKHGEISLKYPQKYIELLKNLFKL